jgi:Rod binding domain-containing protein
MQIAQYNAAASSQLPMRVPPRGFAEDAKAQASRIALRADGAKPQAAGELRERFTQFVGEAFFGQMIKAMRSTVGKPAYFHGGRSEEVFQGQLDQQLAQHLTETSATRFAEPMFERQFPRVAETSESNELTQLAQLRRV